VRNPVVTLRPTRQQLTRLKPLNFAIIIPVRNSKLTGRGYVAPNRPTRAQPMAS
jgi:hypothetical protein